MARLHSGLGDRTVYTAAGLAKAQGFAAKVYEDPAGTVLANLAVYDPTAAAVPGAVIPGAALVVDAFSNRPAFWDLNDRDVLYITVAGGPLEPIRPDAQPQVTALAAAIAASAQRAANLSDLANAATARTNLGLAGAATRNVGITAGTVAAGDDGRIAGAVQSSVVDAKGDLIVGTASDAVTRLAVGADGLVPYADPAASEGIAWRVKDPDAYPSGVAAMDRLVAASNAAAWASGNLRLTYFTAPRSETWTAIAAVTGGSAAAATPTLCRMGVYSVAGNGDLTLLAACANDTSLFAAGSARYTRSLTASVNAVAGQRYAHGLLVVSAAAMPSFRGGGTDAALAALAPRVAGTIGGQSDLPASIAAGALGGVGVVHFGEVL